MKKILFGSAFILVSFLLFGCKKNDTSSSSGNGSQWTVQGVTYTGVHTAIGAGTFGGSSVVTTSDLESADLSGDYISFIFAQTPTANATYTITDGTVLSSNVCSLIMHVQNGNMAFFPAASGATVNVTVSNGKVTASFSNIPVESSSYVNSTVSGTVIEE